MLERRGQQAGKAPRIVGPRPGERGHRRPRAGQADHGGRDVIDGRQRDRRDLLEQAGAAVGNGVAAGGERVQRCQVPCPAAERLLGGVGPLIGVVRKLFEQRGQLLFG